MEAHSNNKGKIKKKMCLLFSFEIGVMLGGRKYIIIGWQDNKILSSYQFYQLMLSQDIHSQTAL